MTRGNQRDKAREKNLKDQAAQVGSALPQLQHLDPSVRHCDVSRIYRTNLLCSEAGDTPYVAKGTNSPSATEKEEHTVGHRIPTHQRGASSHYARKTGKRWVHLEICNSGTATQSDNQSSRGRKDRSDRFYKEEMTRSRAAGWQLICSSWRGFRNCL